MKRFWALLFIFLSARLVLAQEWEVTLTSGETYSRVRLDALRSDSLSFNARFYSLSVPLDSVAGLKFESHLKSRLWGVAGGAAGFYGGLLFGKAFSEKIFEMPLEPREDPVVLFPTAVGAVLGTVFALDYAQESGRGVVKEEYDLSVMPLEEKVRTVNGLLQLHKWPVCPTWVKRVIPRL